MAPGAITNPNPNPNPNHEDEIMFGLLRRMSLLKCKIDKIDDKIDKVDVRTELLKNDLECVQVDIEGLLAAVAKLEEVQAEVGEQFGKLIAARTSELAESLAIVETRRSELEAMLGVRSALEVAVDEPDDGTITSEVANQRLRAAMEAHEIDLAQRRKVKDEARDQRARIAGLQHPKAM